MKKPVIIAERVRTTPDRCWEVGIGTRKRNWAIHLSIGRPVWWLPNAGRRRYSGITELRFGWLLMAVQIAWKPQS